MLYQLKIWLGILLLFNIVSNYTMAIASYCSSVPLGYFIWRVLHLDVVRNYIVIKCLVKSSVDKTLYFWYIYIQIMCVETACKDPTGYSRRVVSLLHIFIRHWQSSHWHLWIRIFTFFVSFLEVAKDKIRQKICQILFFKMLKNECTKWKYCWKKFIWL